ncbi:MAG: VWA domain-containing protein [Flavobacteriales bacterium]|nr:VWA domain-containing protein [Flavobacteriales bacterium]
MSNRPPYRLSTIAGVVLVIELITWLVLLAAGWFLLYDLPGFRFERPVLLWGLLCGPLMVIIHLVHMGWRNRALARFAAPITRIRMVPGTSSFRTTLRFLLQRHGIALVIIALAGPQFGARMEEVKAEGIDVVVAVDVSNSMDCEDLRPSRIDVARRALSQLIDRLQGDRLGIVVFAGEAFVQLPITTDRSAARMFTASVDTRTVGTQGTAIGAAIELATQSFSPDAPGSRAIIVITDGENHEDDAEGAAREAAKAGIVVHTIGMGTAQGGPIPLKRNGQVQGFRKDRDGRTVVSVLDEDMLRRIAAAGNGLYLRASNTSSGITELVDQLRTMDTSETGTYRFTAHEDRYQVPLALGIVLLILGIVIAEDRTRAAIDRSILP